MKPLKDVLADLRPYIARLMIETFPTKYAYPGTQPYSSPALIYTFTLFGAVRKEFCTSPMSTSISLRTATSNMIRTKSRDTMVLYVTSGGALVLCPSAHNLALRLKFPPGLSLNTRWPVLSLNPSSCEISPSCSSDAILLLVISSLIISTYKVLLFSLLVLSASGHVFGTRIPYLCVFASI